MEFLAINILTAITFALILALFWLITWSPLGEPFQELESKYVEIKDFKVHYLQTGKGPHVMLLHGIGASTYCWRFLIPLLAPRYTVTILDLPGFGRSGKFLKTKYDLDSQAKRLIETLDALKITDCKLVGCSMGGLLSLWMAKLQPHRFSKIVALAPAADPKLVKIPFAPFNRFAGFMTFVMNRKVMEQILYRTFHRRELVNPESIEAYMYPYRSDRNTLRTFVLATEALRDSRLPQALAEVKKPVLLLYGNQDRTVPEKSITPLLKILPNVTFERTDGGHHLMEDAPEWCGERILRFLS